MTSASFIHVSCGVPRPVNALPVLASTRLGVMARFWEDEHVFSAEASYEFRLAQVPTYNWLQRAAAQVAFNPRVLLTGEWQVVGPYSRDRLIAIVKLGLASDDDIVQQWFEAPDVVRLLEGASSFSQMLLAADAVTGGHEVNAETRAYVEQVLGPRPPDE